MASGFMGFLGFCKKAQLHEFVDFYGFSDVWLIPQSIKYSNICKFVGLNVSKT